MPFRESSFALQEKSPKKPSPVEVPDKYSEEINQQTLQRALKAAGVQTSSQELKQLWAFHCHLRKRNPSLNLTRLHNFDAIVRKHYIDCLLVPRILEEVGLNLHGRILDIGTGAGFPGVLLAIVCPKLHVILGEGRRQRTEFLKEVIQILGLKNVEVFEGRIHSYQGHDADFVITRALESMKDTLRHAIGNTTRTAKFIFMKGPNCDAEIKGVLHLNRHGLVLDKGYKLPDSTDKRRLVVWSLRPSNLLKSPENKKLKLLRSLLQSRGIKKEGRCLVFGQKLVSEILKKEVPKGTKKIQSETNLPPKIWQGQDGQKTKGIEAKKSRRPSTESLQFHREPLHEIEAIISHPEQALPEHPGHIPIWDLQPTFFKEIDILGTQSPFLLLRYQAMQEWHSSIYEQGLVVVLPLQDPLNLGAAIRSSLAFKASYILLTREAAHPFHPKAIRASAGASLTAPLFSAPSLHTLSKDTFQKNALPVKEPAPKELVPHLELLILDVDSDGVSGENLLNFSFPKNCVMIVGEEGQGIPKALTQNSKKLAIPLHGRVESLNATVSLSVALYEYQRQTSL